MWILSLQMHTRLDVKKVEFFIDSSVSSGGDASKDTAEKQKQRLVAHKQSLKVVDRLGRRDELAHQLLRNIMCGQDITEGHVPLDLACESLYQPPLNWRGGLR